MIVLKRLTRNKLVLYQRLGHFDEHLASFYSLAFGEPYIYKDTYLLYYDRFSKILYFTLFELNGHEDKLQCIETAAKLFEPEEIVTDSPEKLQPDIGDFHCTNIHFDRDYQIYLPNFDETLKGNTYKDLRYRVHNAIKRGYSLEIGRKMTPAHYHLVACHETARKCDLWDNQLYLSIRDYLKHFSSPLLFNVLSNGVLIGFDVVDFLNDTTMTIPLGFYLDYPSLADFILFKEIVYAKERGYTWLDLGWACNSGVESFKRKWMAEPKFEIWTQEYVKNGVENRNGAWSTPTQQL
ncbi:MAG: phosphatidylglycerol lysyltransferase domain-containing protein [Candidatus Bathyarchaeaceae archaeon]